LLKPPQGSEASYKIGSDTGVVLETEDIAAKFQEWSACGVRFTQTPDAAALGHSCLFSGPRWQQVRSDSGPLAH
jgi:hypothetical protein